MAIVRSRLHSRPASGSTSKWAKSFGSADPPVDVLMESVHLLQIERGKSATWIASATKAAGLEAAGVTQDVYEARNIVDAYTFEYAKEWPKEKPLKHELAVLRACTDSFRHPILTAGLEADARAFLSVLSGYTKLIELFCATIDKQLQVGWHGSMLRSLIRFDEAMAHQRGLLCSLLVLPDRLFSALRPIPVLDLKGDSRMQTQISSTLASMLQANKVDPRCHRLVSASISFSRRLQSVQAQLISSSQLSLLRDTMTVQECWSLFSQHLEDNRVAKISLAAHFSKFAHRGLPVFFHRVRGNTDIDMKMMRRNEQESLRKAGTVPAYGTSSRWGDRSFGSTSQSFGGGGLSFGGGGRSFGGGSRSPEVRSRVLHRGILSSSNVQSILQTPPTPKLKSSDSSVQTV